MNETKFPPLPDPKWIYHDSDVPGEDDLLLFADFGAVDEECPICERLYTADQMRAYAEAYHREACAKPSKFNIGDRVRKIKGSEWEGVVVGTYSTALTPEGYAVESAAHSGSVQIYPASALEACAKQAWAGAWSEDPPMRQGWYWHWNGDEDSAPIPTSVMWSGSTKRCFVSIGQLGISKAIDCDQYGGFWIPLVAPQTNTQMQDDALDAAVEKARGRFEAELQRCQRTQPAASDGRVAELEAALHSIIDYAKRDGDMIAQHLAGIARKALAEHDAKGGA